MKDSFTASFDLVCQGPCVKDSSKDSFGQGPYVKDSSKDSFGQGPYVRILKKPLVLLCFRSLRGRKALVLFCFC